MSYQVPPDLERQINERMSQGGYASQDELLRDALRALDEVGQYRPTSPTYHSLEDLRREIWRGLRELDSGAAVDGETLFAELQDGTRPAEQG